MSDLNNIHPLSAVGAGVDIASGLASTLDSVFGWSAKRQHRMQKDLMNTQQDQWKEQQNILARQQLEQWNRENEYNDPTNYFKLLMAGADGNGLSKAAVLGDMPGGTVGQSATGVTAPGSTSAPGVGGSTLLPFGSSNVLGAMRQRAEIANIEAQTSKTEKETEESDSRIALNKANRDVSLQTVENLKVSGVSEKIKQEGYIIANALAYFDLSVAGERHAMDMEKQWASVQSAYASAYKEYQQGKNQEISNKYADENAIVQLALSRSMIALNEWSVKEKEAIISKYGADTAKVQAETDKLNRFVDDEAKILHEQAKYAPLYQFTNTYGKLSQEDRYVIGFMNPDFDPREAFTDKWNETMAIEKAESSDSRRKKIGSQHKNR